MHKQPEGAASGGRLTGGTRRRARGALLLSLLPFVWGSAWGATYDWGVIPVGQPQIINFAATDITNNFTDQYAFSIQGGTDASYAVTVTFDVCARGCGNPSLSYALYTASGQLFSDTGSANLTAGNYYLRALVSQRCLPTTS